ncbi:MAG: hypothetical protein AAGA70_18105 [Pseudomonadota bacterium]
MRNPDDENSLGQFDLEGEINAKQVDDFFRSDRYGGTHIDLEAEAIEDARRFPDEDLDEIRLRASMRSTNTQRGRRVPAAIAAFVGTSLITLSIGGILRETFWVPDMPDLRLSMAYAPAPEPVETSPLSPMDSGVDPARLALIAQQLAASDPAEIEIDLIQHEIASAEIAAHPDPDARRAIEASWREIARLMPDHSLLIAPKDSPHAVLLFAGPDGLTAAPANLPAMHDARPVLWQVGDHGVTRFLAELGAGPVTLPGVSLEMGKRFLVSLEPEGPVSNLPAGPIVMQGKTF